MNNIYIYGARATAVGFYKAVSRSARDKVIKGFLVTDAAGNPAEICGIKVKTFSEVSQSLSQEEKYNVEVYIAALENVHAEICKILDEAGFKNIIPVDSKKEADIMERYYEAENIFHSVHKLPADKVNLPDITVYTACFYKDKPLINSPDMLNYMKKLLLGCSVAKQAGFDISNKADFYDDTGENISFKNPNRCEMTAYYWIWKNRLNTNDEYVGVYHYRRFLDISDDDLRRIKANDVDVVLPFPMIHYPNASVHHTWYVKEEDWTVMRKVVRELYPEYDAAFDEIFSQPYFYNYNITIAKKKVFADYCSWLFPILDAVEERSSPIGKDRADRYTAYMSESLATLYFMYHRRDLKIYHAGRILYI
ncbi:MAG: DUF4422 domain-containing protein [Selenomonadaceae bacterium]|nr:DUF4422 domain-containing protein [Selenomonadaceae bacterium]